MTQALANERSPDIALYPEEVMKVVNEHGWDFLAYWFVRPLIDLTRVGFVCENMEGFTEVAARERTFIFSNHISWADHFLIYYFLIRDKPFRGSAVAKEKYFKWPGAREIMRLQNCIPITNIKITFARWFHEQHGRAPTEADFVAFMDEHGHNMEHEVHRRKAASMARTAQHTGTMLDRGRVILGYPEGTRSKTGRMQATKTGIMQLPLMHKGTIMPTAVMGTDKILNRESHWYDFFKYFFWKGPTIECRFGEPLRWDEALTIVEQKFAAQDDPVDLARVRQLRDQVTAGTFQAFSAEAARFERIFDEVALLTMRRINTLLPEEYRAPEAVEIKYTRAP